MVVNTKQRIAVLASGLVVATSGIVTDESAAAPAVTQAPGPVAAVADQLPADGAGPPAADGPVPGARGPQAPA